MQYHLTMSQPLAGGSGERDIGFLRGLIGGAGLVTAALLAYLPLFVNASEFPGMVATGTPSHDVVGDLGGMPVTIPRHFADLVEYSGDPAWGEARKGPRPRRTHASRLASFGFYVRFPDMAGLSTPELRQHKQSQGIYNTMWISVGVTTGDIYPGHGFLDRQADALDKPDGILKYEHYEKLPGQLFGLTVYAAAGTNPQTNKPYREHSQASDRFVHRRETGRVDTYIRCNNVTRHVATCKQNFSLEPDAKAKIYVSYRRDLLPHWQQIQASVAQLILSFKTAPTSSEASHRAGESVR